MGSEEILDGHISELKGLMELDIIPQETKEEISKAIKFAESTKNMGNMGKDNKLKIKFVNKSEFKNPNYAQEGDSGFDLRATEGGALKSLERKLVSTGLFFELPKGCELQIRPRSGMAYKHGITVLNTPGTIDNGYRGEVKVLLVNLSNEDFTWDKGDRIAQGVISHRVASETAELVEVSELSESERNEGGFGSTGKK